jgi:hypothetical protein
MDTRQVNGKPPESKVSEWVCRHYEVLSIAPNTPGFLAVYAMEAEGGEGGYELRAVPLDLLAVAKVTERTMRGVYRTAHSPRCVGEETYRRVVGLELADGEFFVVNESENYAGLVRPGEGLGHLASALPRTYRDRLKAG